MLSVIEIQTVLLEVEVILNSRPICALYDNDLAEALTPNHLLYGRKLHQYNPVPHEGNLNTIVAPKRVRYIETLIENFWSRWRVEYVNSLRELK